MRIDHCLNNARKALAGISDSPALDAELLLAQSLGKGRTYLYAFAEQHLTEQQQLTFQALLERRLQAEPVAYILGSKEFWSLELEVNPAVLIPRPDTELLVEQALQHLPMEQSAKVLDMGTGSGAIAIALATERPHIQLVALDQSAQALVVAQRNAQRHCPNRVQWLQSDWFNALLACSPNQRFELIVSNPPYIERADAHLAALTHEPISALASGRDGLEDIRTIAVQAPKWLQPNGWLWLEHGHEQGASCRALLQQAGFQTVSSQRDLAGLERISGGQWQP